MTTTDFMAFIAIVIEAVAFLLPKKYQEIANSLMTVAITIVIASIIIEVIM